MEKITVPVDKLREIVQRNRDEHRHTFDQAQLRFRARAIEELDRRLRDAEGGRKINLAIQLPTPEDHTDDYDRVLRMLDLTVDSTVELSEEDVAMYVQDDWAWKRAWYANTVSYVSA